jgi:spore coat polysaccharide biosynthesis protein SpsF
MTAVVLQARLDSKRLPGKSLLPLGGLPLVFRVMEALNRVPSELRVLACPEDCTIPFAPWAERAGFVLFPGSREDVLARYAGAIRRFSIDRLIRATGDNPFVFADAAEALNKETVEAGAAYGGYTGLPHGAGVESVDAGALLRAEQEAREPGEREHVCPYLYGHPELFRLHRPPAPPRWEGGELRITVDTLEDYRRARSLYGALPPGEERYRGESILAVLRTPAFAKGGVPPPGRTP